MNILALLAIVLSLQLTACTPWRSAYLKESVGQATQDEVATRLGPPANERILSTGETVWLYRSTGAAVGQSGGSSWCIEYVLTFSTQKVLRRWNRQNC